MRTRIGCWALGMATLGAGFPAFGQRSHDFAIIVGGDAGVLPDGFTSRCGRSPTGMPGVSGFAAVRYQPVKASGYVQLDLRVARPENGACTADLPLTVLSPTEYETRPGIRYSDLIPRSPFGASVLRLGAERQVRALAAGVFAGGGLAWGRRPVPLAAGGLSVSFGRGPLRVTLEGERTLAWVGGAETRSRRTFGPPDREIAQRVIANRDAQPWTVVRAAVLWRRR